MSERNDRTPAALYARVSSDRQDVDLSVSAQLRALRDYADKNDYEVVREYVDEAESGRVMNRPEFQKMLDEAKRTEAPFKEIFIRRTQWTRKTQVLVGGRFGSIQARSVKRTQNGCVTSLPRTRTYHQAR